MVKLNAPYCIETCRKKQTQKNRMNIYNDFLRFGDSSKELDGKYTILKALKC